MEGQHRICWRRVGTAGLRRPQLGQFLADRLGRPWPMWTIRWKRRPAAPSRTFSRKKGGGLPNPGAPALCQLSKQSGQVIACGGGIVTRRENWDPMRQNSTVIYLRRDLELLPTSGRPVSQAIPPGRTVPQTGPAL